MRTIKSSKTNTAGYPHRRGSSGKSISKGHSFYWIYRYKGQILINIFAFYFLMLVFLPPMHNCSRDIVTPGTENAASHNSEHDSHSGVPCSPFCGEIGCGIVIDIQFDIPHIEVYATDITERPVFYEHVAGHSFGSIWHPPKV